MKKKSIFFTIIALLSIVIIPFVTHANDTLTFEMVNNNAKDLYNEGDTFQVIAGIKFLPSGFQTVAANIVFDPDKLEVVDGPKALNDALVMYDDQAADKISIGHVLNTPKAGDMVDITFKVKPGATGSTEIQFSGINGNLTNNERVTTGNSNSLTINFATPLQSITLDSTKTNIGVGESTIVNVSYVPTDTTDSKKITWKSSDASVAKVDSNGKVTGVSTGTATITATSEVTSVRPATITINVVSELQAISLNKSSTDITKGKDETLVVSYDPTNTTSDRTIRWTSSDESVATVDSNGKVTGVNYGKATITATSVVSGIDPVTCEVTVSNHLKSIALDENEFNLNRGDNKSLRVSYNAENANEDTTDDKTVTWTSSDDAIATVDSNGKVTAVGKGTATITANVTGVPTATAKVTVSVPLQSISLDDDFELQPQGSKTLSVIYNPTDADNKNVEWSSSDNTVVSVDANGKVTAKKPGVATITVDAGNNITDTVIITVPEVNVETVIVSKSETTIEKGKNETLTASYLPENATDAIDVTWTSDDESIATVDENGKVTAKKAGTTNINATINGKKASCKVTVIIPLKSISLEKDSITLNKTETADAVNVIYNPEDTTDDKTVIWTSKNTSVATVDNTGKITATAVGSAVIEAKVGDKTATLTVDVKSPLKSISIKSQTTLVKKQTETLSVTYEDNDTTDSKKVTWESSDEKIATVDENGKVTAKKAGTATITATSDVSGVSPVRCTVTVTEIKIDSVQISNKIDTLAKGKTHTFNALVTPSNTTDDYEYEWSSSDESIATIDENGKVTAKKAGKTTIKVKANLTNENALPHEDELELEVIEIPMTGVTLETNKTKMEVGDNTNLTVKFLPSDTTDSKDVTFASSDENILTVDESGKITAKKAGTAVVSVITANGLKSQVEITVVPKETNKSTSPSTNDNSILYVVLLILSGTGLGIAIKKKNMYVK